MAYIKTMLSAAILIGIAATIDGTYEKKLSIKEKDLMHKSIVFDKKTPDLFYCPTQKPSAMNKLIVRSRPLHKLCEYEGRPLPEDYKSDCFDDIDESNYACKEKYRIMWLIKVLIKLRRKYGSTKKFPNIMESFPEEQLKIQIS